MTKTTKKIKYPCPVYHCKADLSKDGINSSQSGENTYKVSTSGGFLDYDEAEFYDDSQQERFYCRQCGNELPDKWQSENAIIKILKKYV